jgi:hypothetical protein
MSIAWEAAKEPPHLHIFLEHSLKRQIEKKTAHLGYELVGNRFVIPA